MIKIENLSHEGRGVGHYLDGKAVFVKNALPDEEVAITLTRKHRQYDEAKATEIMNPSPLRVEPKCAVFGICGGCSLQHLATHAQIELKQSWLAEKLQHAKVTTEAWLSPLQAKTWGYRHKARLGVRFVRKKNEVLVGFREADSNFLTNMNRCEVLHPSVGEHLAELKTLLSTLSIREEIPQIEVAVDDTHTALIIRHMVPMPEADLAKLKALYDQFGWIILLQPKGIDTVHQVFPEQAIELKYHLSSPRERSSEFANEGERVYIHFQPTDFTQVNFSLNPLMIKQALDLLDPQKHETILDLFCGLGNFTLPIASFAGKVIAVEGDAVMLNRADANAKGQGFSNIDFHTANLFELKDKEPFYAKADKLLLDPPRAGAEAVCRNIEKFNPKAIVYVSCEPSTLVRDLAILVNEKGYILKKIGVMDMFPHTSHVESMASLERA